jgi:DNA recombination protein RmuC
MTSLLVLIALAVGLAAGVLLGRRQAPLGDDAELVEARTDLTAARTELTAARTELTEVHRALADARVQTAEAQSQIAVARTERDNALARIEDAARGQQAMVEQFKLLSHEVAEQQRRSVDSSAQQRLQATEQMLAPVTTTLQQLQARLTEVEKDRAKLSAELQGQVRAVRDTGEALRKETAALVTALRKPQVRGSWGETTLRNVAKLAGMVEHCDFDLQVTSRPDGQALRPDMRVHLAEGKHVIVDSKVPLSAFLDAAETEDEEQKAVHLGRFAAHVRTHVDQLSAKQYWKSAESPEFVVLFLPNEGFFAAALDQMPDLYEYAIGKDVVIATPTTLIGMLRAVSYGWKQAALAKDAAEVARLGRELHDRLGNMGGHFARLGKALTSAVGAYNDTVGSVETRVLVTARKLRDFKVTEKDLETPQAIDTAVRELQQPELTARPVPTVAELVEADADHSALSQGSLWGEDDLSQEA